ncbi:MAG: hypothetical protein OHK0011_27340 [Turneriella sp.]
MKQLTQFLAAAAIAGALSGCLKTDDDQPKTLIFEGTEAITLISPSDNTSLSGNFTYTVPSEVKYVVFGLFNAAITTSGKSITNPSAFVAGSRDGLSDFVRGSQARAALHAYNQSTKDFDAAATGAAANPYYWAVWGYDQFGNLTHSSPQRRVTLP